MTGRLRIVRDETLKGLHYADSQFGDSLREFRYCALRAIPNRSRAGAASYLMIHAADSALPMKKPNTRARAR
jgi:hypothetical protein